MNLSGTSWCQALQKLQRIADVYELVVETGEFVQLDKNDDFMVFQWELRSKQPWNHLEIAIDAQLYGLHSWIHSDRAVKPMRARPLSQRCRVVVSSCYLIWRRKFMISTLIKCYNLYDSQIGESCICDYLVTAPNGSTFVSKVNRYRWSNEQTSAVWLSQLSGWRLKLHRSGRKDGLRTRAASCHRGVLLPWWLRSTWAWDLVFTSSTLDAYWCGSPKVSSIALNRGEMQLPWKPVS